VTDFTPLVLFGVLLVRVGMLVATTPLLGGSWAPPQLKVGLTVILAAVLMPFVTLPAIATPAELTLVVAHEAVIGLALAMGVRILLSAAELAGYLVGFQLGFGYAGIIDPQSGVRNNVLAVLYASMTTLVLLGTNLHHQVIRLLLATYETVPVAPATAAHSSGVEAVTRMLGLVFTTGAQLAAPIVLVLLFVELVMGVVSRAAPSLNLMVIGAPLRLIVGLFALGLSIQVVPGVMARASAWGLELGARLAMAFR
jgi:flagellar biosynthesis protein FliR